MSSSDLTWTFFNGHQETMAPIGHRQIGWHLVVAMCTLVMRIQRPLQNVAVQVILLQCVRRMVQKRSSKPSTRKVLQGCNLPLKLLNPSSRRRRSSNGTQQRWLRMSLIESTVYDLPEKMRKTFGTSLKIRIRSILVSPGNGQIGNEFPWAIYWLMHGLWDAARFCYPHHCIEVRIHITIPVTIFPARTTNSPGHFSFFFKMNSYRKLNL